MRFDRKFDLRRAMKPGPGRFGVSVTGVKSTYFTSYFSRVHGEMPSFECRLDVTVNNNNNNNRSNY